MRATWTVLGSQGRVLRAGRGARILAIVAAACVLAASLSLQPAQQSYAAGTLDQSYEIAASGVPMGGSDWVAQTFTAGLTGNLDQVDLALQSNAFGSSDQIVVEVRSTVGGLPAGAGITSGTLAELSLENQLPRFYSIPMTPAPVVAGTQYAIVIHKPSGPPSTGRTLAVLGSTSGDYAGGQAFISTNFGASFAPNSGVTDFAFRTYVTQSAATSTMTPTATATMTPTATPTSIPVTCSPRPRVLVSVAATAPGQITATIQASGSGNVLSQLRIAVPSNATVTAGSANGTGTNLTVTLPAGTTSTTLIARRNVAGQAITVPLIVVDSCGDWRTFVGAGTSVP